MRREKLKREKWGRKKMVNGGFEEDEVARV